MKARKSIVAVVLSLCMIFSCVAVGFAESSESNLSMEVSSTTVDVGKEVTVTIKLKQSLSDISWIVGGVNFDKEAFQCTSIKSAAGTTSELDVLLHVEHGLYNVDRGYENVDKKPEALATTETAANTGAVGFAFWVSAETGATVSMPGEYIIKATFKSLKAGTADFTLYEQTTTIPDHGDHSYYQGEEVPGSKVTVTATQPEHLIGDADGDNDVTDADVEFLLFYTLFPDDFELAQDAATFDFNHDGSVDDADVEYLLFYTLFPDDFPLE